MKLISTAAAAGLLFMMGQTSEAFAPINARHGQHAQQLAPTSSPPFTTRLLAADDANESNAKRNANGGVDTNMRSKLLTESIAPWRTLRLFLYGALGSGAFLGGLVNGSGAIANSASPDFNLNTELLNLGIDFGAVALFAFLFKFDLDKQGELTGKVDDRLEQKKKMKEVKKGMKQRESLLASLPLEITISNDGQTQRAKVGELQAGAKQHMIIVAGPRRACKDALIGANLLKMDFAMGNVLVVPYQTDADAAIAEPSGGFGDRPIYETQPYVATPPRDEWQDFIDQEMKDAVEQNGESVKKDGIAIVVASNGKIIRRGIGTVPWRIMVEELQGSVAAA
mmetsp:Transcript_16565/g.46321  ORF Transcript_16565/g.46321 Transcript_16565/m.46321 type:complete len:339 (+) Transcript_16565:99-1115(+)|eukprot:CAMPEP_0119561210 /NCGR_PEP_ID=MMETSP1352-20130426/16999_1 /TAXON_ID=265584 /ORGANISM="Stauroneis constricta, Strain CCMP1120" /LENGTH=338 /DNA_ID=CAMNT_0007609371 /DNA_START=55 /DNA_END=1071 /DNA_ORIENTATION=+